MSVVSQNYVMEIIEPNLSEAQLRTKRNEKTGIYDLKESEYSHTYTFPMPKIDGFSGSYVTTVDGGNNANGDYEGVVVSSKVNISGFSWVGLGKQTGRDLLAVFAGGENLTFFAKYFDVALGTNVIRQFRRGDITYEFNNIVETMENGVLKMDIDYWKNISIPVNEV